MDEFKMELHSPLTEEEWNILTDAELERTNTIEFTTPSQKKIMFQKVKYGKWIATGFMEVKCSICGAIQHELEDTNFCPNCGARWTERSR